MPEVPPLRAQVLAALPDATVLGRAPGRVNLIGEHTDYNGFPVLPFAIDRAIWCAAARRDHEMLVVRNLDSARFPSETVALTTLGQRPCSRSWVDYVVAAARIRPPATGVELVIGGDVPIDAGLSSSSALLNATLMALAEPGDRNALAEEARVAERYVGTNSGGMDQAISLLGETDHALRIDFFPLRVKKVALPAALAVVVCDSGVSAPKGGAAQEAYNQRVAECTRAAEALGAPPGSRLSQVPGSLEERSARALRLEDRLLRRRAHFVFEEARRVDLAEEAIDDGDLLTLGKLLDASHRGLRDEYEVSHPAVDALVTKAKAAGAFGARIVGAGFGGCMIAITTRDRAGDLVTALGKGARLVVAAAGASRELLA